MSGAGVKVLIALVAAGVYDMASAQSACDPATIKPLPADGACLGWHAAAKMVGPAYRSSSEARFLAAWVLAGAPAN